MAVGQLLAGPPGHQVEQPGRPVEPHARRHRPRRQGSGVGQLRRAAHQRHALAAAAAAAAAIPAAGGRDGPEPQQAVGAGGEEAGGGGGRGGGGGGGGGHGDELEVNDGAAVAGQQGERPDAGEGGGVGRGREADAAAPAGALLLAPEEPRQPAVEFAVGVTTSTDFGL